MSLTCVLLIPAAFVFPAVTGVLFAVAIGGVFEFLPVRKKHFFFLGVWAEDTPPIVESETVLCDTGSTPDISSSGATSSGTPQSLLKNVSVRNMF